MDAVASLGMRMTTARRPVQSDEVIKTDKVLGIAQGEFCRFYAVEEAPDEWAEFVKAATAPGAALNKQEKESLAAWFEEEEA